MDARQPLAQGAALTLGGRTYHIQGLIGRGATSFVYAATYADSLRGQKRHAVLVKELFPYHPKGLISRAKDGAITFPPEAAAFFELRRKSFIRGNNAHIGLQNVRADMAGMNVDSCEANGSVYTILGNTHGETLQSALRGGLLVTLPTAVGWTQSLLDALEVFHKNRLLHLDISPDNILLLPLSGDKPEKRRTLLLIDYNSVWDMDELSCSDDVYFSVKDSYSAPEVRLMDRRSIGAAADLFSVCAVFAELLQGKPLDFSSLYTGANIGAITDSITGANAGLLANAAPPVKAKAAEILGTGLKLPPKRRYQSIGELRRELNELENLLAGEDALARAVKFFKKRALPVALATLALGFALSFAAIRLNESSRGYPISAQEKYAADSMMAALSVSLGKLGAQLRNDLSALGIYKISTGNGSGDINGNGNGDALKNFIAAVRENEPSNRAHALHERYDEQTLGVFRAGASPVRTEPLLEMLNAPSDYRARSDALLKSLQAVLADARYPSEDKAAIFALCSQYYATYADACFIKIQLIVLPLNEDGRKELLEALPYIPVFGERFVSAPFGGSSAELESALAATRNSLGGIAAQLKSFGMEIQAWG